MANRRTEIDGAFLLGGLIGRLHLSGGAWDDYLELTFPESEAPSRESDGPRPDEESWMEAAAADLAATLAAAGLDAVAHPGIPPAVGVLALRVGDESARHTAPTDRLLALLARVAAAAPALDFGDLLPRWSVAGDGASVSLAAADPPPSAVAAEPAAVVATVSTDEPIESAPLIPSTPPVLVIADLSPSPAEARGKPTAAGLLEEARRRAARGQIVKARRAVEEALALTPALGEAQSLRHELCVLERREKRLASRPRDAQAQLEVGFSRLTLGLVASGVAALATAIRLDPDLYLGHLLLGMAYHRAGQVEEARRSYSIAARLRPSDATASDLARCLARGEPPPKLVEEPRETARPRPFAIGKRIAAAG